MSETYTVTGVVNEEDDRVVIDFGFVRIEVVRDADEGTPLNPMGNQARSGVLFSENEYIVGKEVGLEYGGGRLLAKAELDDGKVETLLEKLKQNKKLGEDDNE